MSIQNLLSKHDWALRNLWTGRENWSVLVAYGLAVIVLVLDLWVPKDFEVAICYAVSIALFGLQRSRPRLWTGTAIFMAFLFADVFVGAPSMDPPRPWWVLTLNRSLLACALLVIAVIVHNWIASLSALEARDALLAKQNEELRASEALLEERVQERTRDLEAASTALHQAQKMEAMGQLTGGVAHDFNNLLTIVAGNADMLAHRAQSERERGFAAEILRASERGQRLTRHLLTFGRRQMLRPQAVDLRQGVGASVELLTRSLRENIRVVYALAPDLWPVKVDPVELELALINIGVNARDAMPDGGTLRVEAHNVTLTPDNRHETDLVGDYVVITLSDTGTGIEPSALPRVFEPFFTTKGPGKGSGLGLSQVYGFCKQSGGAATIRSEVGRGTDVALYLPRFEDPVHTAQRSASSPAGERVSGRVLYVEDNAEVAATTEAMLRELGFEIRSVASAAQALSILERGEKFDLVFSDVVMPGAMNGIELRREIQRRFPNVPVLLTSGYLEGGPASDQNGPAILAKPYRAETLREALGAYTSE